MREMHNEAEIADTTRNKVVSIDELEPDRNQSIDERYSAKIQRYTTAQAFNTPLTDYLPHSTLIPTPEAALGDVAGAPDYLPTVAMVHNYFYRLAQTTERVHVFSIGKSEEGRKMIAVAIASEKVMRQLQANCSALRQLADPRMLERSNERALQVIEQSIPVYYIMGSVHAPETGAPTALMELAYRLAVDNSAYVDTIRTNVITLITPIVDVDGRERMVDLYNWHKMHPNATYSRLIYWSHYVELDINRDSLGLNLKETRNILDTYMRWHPQVVHDLHESVPLLYDDTMGTGPYNPWFDSINNSESQKMAWSGVSELMALGLPGVFTHGVFDEWYPGYLKNIGKMRNSISRLYETYGNAGADTLKRTISPNQYKRTWYKADPPPPVVLWSQRNNNNYIQSGLLVSLFYAARNRKSLLKTYWMSSKRAVQKPHLSGPAAYVFPAEETHTAEQAHLLRLIRMHHLELHKASERFTVFVDDGAMGEANAMQGGADVPKSHGTARRSFGRGSWIVRMDQPYSGVADQLLDRGYWSPVEENPPYDDTGWSFGDLFNVDVVRVLDPAILNVPMELVDSKVEGTPLSVKSLGVRTKTSAPRIALMHTWLSTRRDGWWRLALDSLKVDYEYVSTQDIARNQTLRDMYDVIIFAPIGHVTDRMIIDGLPMYGSALPWESSELTPNIGNIDSTRDMRPGLGDDGVSNLKRFVGAGGVFIASEDTARFAITIGITPGVTVASTKALKVAGSLLRAMVVDRESVITDGYADAPFAMYSDHGMAFEVSSLTVDGRDIPGGWGYWGWWFDRDVAGMSFFDRGVSPGGDANRSTGRGGPREMDATQGRKRSSPPRRLSVKPWELAELAGEQSYNNPFVIPPARRPVVLVRWCDEKDLLISGLLDHGEEIAGRPAVVLARYGDGHVVLFGSDPLHRGETIGTYRMFCNAAFGLAGI